jgi:hypothetical protein
MATKEKHFYSIYHSDQSKWVMGKETDAVLRWYAVNRSEDGGLRDANAAPIPLFLRRRVRELPAIIDVNIHYQPFFLVNRRFAELIAPFLHIPPIMVPVSGYPKRTNDESCAIVDVTTVIDAANLQASEAYVWDNNPDSSPELLSCTVTFLDPARIPADIDVFYIRRIHGTVYSSAVKQALQRAKVPDLAFSKLKYVVEPEASRQDYLKKLERDTVLLREKIQNKTKHSRPEPDAACIAGWACIKRALGRNVGKEFESHNIFDEDDFLEHNTLLRHDEELAWPTDYWAIAEDGRGGYWTLRLDANGTATGDVWYYDHELATPGPKGGKATPNFESCAPSLRSWVTLLKKGEDGL